MGKLHELLAVESDLKAQAQRDVSATTNLFTSGQGKLVGQIRTYEPLTDADEDYADDVTELGTTVVNELGTVRSSFGKWLDAALQKEITNRDTNASVVVGEVAVLDDLPAPALLNLESKLAELRRVYEAIPTNDPTEVWHWDDNQECYVSEPRITYKTKKTLKTHIAYEATEQHPAQTQTYSEDVRAGAWTTIIHSGMVTPRQKRLYLHRIDVLLQAVKQARMRANMEDVDVVNIADAIFGFIHQDKL